MGIRRAVGSKLESAIGRDRTNTIRKAERRARNALARQLAMEPPKKPVAKRSSKQPTKPPASNPELAAKPLRRRPSDPFVSHPEPTMTRHELLRELHEKTQPRTYLEIGVNNGASLVLSHARSIGVDPSFRVDKPSTVMFSWSRQRATASLLRSTLSLISKAYQSTWPSSTGCICPSSRCVTS